MSSDWQPSPRYPDPLVVAVDESFNKYRLMLAKVERLYTGTRWAEGPVWFGDRRSLIWSDVPGNRMYRWDEETGATSVFRAPSANANGNTRDRQGRLLTCEHLGRRVCRTEHDGRIVTLADSFQGKRLNSPNDIVCKSDGSIWFTDPSFGILGYYVVGGTKLANRRLLIDAEPKGSPDGFRVDVDGNLWCGWGMGEAGLDGVHVFNPDGRLIGHIDLPERCANLCFGGLHRNRLFMAASTSLYSLYVNTQGVPYF
jgi:gluconolactonase